MSSDSMGKSQTDTSHTLATVHCDIPYNTYQNLPQFPHVSQDGQSGTFYPNARLNDNSELGPDWTLSGLYNRGGAVARLIKPR